MLERESNALLKLSMILAQAMKREGLKILSSHCDRLLSLESSFKPRYRRLEKKHWIREWVAACKDKMKEDAMLKKAMHFSLNSSKVLKLMIIHKIKKVLKDE
jgi:hypothetical protein